MKHKESVYVIVQLNIDDRLIDRGGEKERKRDNERQRERKKEIDEMSLYRENHHLLRIHSHHHQFSDNMNNFPHHDTLNIPFNDSESLLSTESILRFNIGTSIVYVFNNGSLLFIENDGTSTFVNRSNINDQIPPSQRQRYHDDDDNDVVDGEEIREEDDEGEGDGEREEQIEWDSPQSPDPQDYHYEWCPHDNINYVVID